jgi:hypothetical protein
MAAGDVEVRIVNAIDTEIDDALTAMRITAGVNGKYLVCAIGPENQQVLLIAISET